MTIDSQLRLLFDDITILLKKDDVLAKDVANFINKFNTDDVKNYLNGLTSGSKAEQALRESFFTINSPFSRYFFEKVFPEVNEAGGFIDYLIKANREEISLEIKPLFNGIFISEKGKKIFKKLKKIPLNPDNHKDQIAKYLEGTREYVVLTNLEEWYFYSKSYSLPPDTHPFSSINIIDLMKEFKEIGDFWFYLDKKEDLSNKKPLDKYFFDSLKIWVKELSKIDFIMDDDKKMTLIINLLNKFIFIQSLDKFWVIEKNYLATEWERIERRWIAKDKRTILEKFLKEINEYIYELYDTELFKKYDDAETILDYLNEDENNISSFYDKVKLILGIEFGSTSGYERGIIQYNFRRIDEDILGKSYETFLAEIRKEQGIYYTPKYITQFIVENTVGVLFDDHVSQIVNKLREEDFSRSAELICKLFEIKILDPSCGSGSFLIKTLKVIWEKYQKIITEVNKIYKKYGNFKHERSQEMETKYKEIQFLSKLLNVNDIRTLISKIILYHLYGNDLDSKALSVAKLNLWLEGIKLAPREFHYDRLPKDTRHILPNLEVNLNNGDSLVSLPQDQLNTILCDNYEDVLKKLSFLRQKYLEDPSNIELSVEMNAIKEEIKKDLNIEIKSHIKDLNLSKDAIMGTIPFYWSLDYWYVFFDNDAGLKEVEKRGFDAIVGNPPYFTIRGKGTGSIEQSYCYEYLKKDDDWHDYFRSQSDIYYYFIIKSIKLLKKGGKFGFIIEDYWLENDYADKLKEFLLSNTQLDLLIKFGNVKKIFEDADNDTCILLFQKKGTNLTSNYFTHIYCKKNCSGESIQERNQKLMEHIINTIYTALYNLA